MVLNILILSSWFIIGFISLRALAYQVEEKLDISEYIVISCLGPINLLVLIYNILYNRFFNTSP